MALKLYTDLLNALYEFTASQAGDFNAWGGTIDTVVTFAENRIFRELRCREMEQTLTSTVTIASGVLALPADYVELKHARLTNETPHVPLKKRTASWIYERYPYRAASGLPRFIAREGTSFIFGPYPDSGSTYTLGGVYWGRPASVIGQTTTASMNAVFLAHPDLYVAATVVAGRRLLKKNDEALAQWEEQYQTIKNDLMREVNAEIYEGSEILGDE